MTFDVHTYTAKVDELLQSGTPFVTVTMVAVRGSAPQILGAKAIVTADGVVYGTVGGGKVEARAIEHSKHLLADGKGKSCELVKWNLQTDIHMTCGGEVQFFFEANYCNEWQIAVFGAGHIAQSLIPILLGMNCRVTWLDQREEWLSKIASHPRLRKVCVQDLASQVATLPKACFIVLMTQGHANDLPVLAETLKTRTPPYLGVLGSVQKAKVLRRDLQEMGVSEEKIASYYCPMGLPLGNNTPPEIAISIVSQLIQVRDESGLIDQRTKKF